MKDKIVRKFFEIFTALIEKNKLLFLRYIDPYKLGYFFGFFLKSLLLRQIVNTNAKNVFCLDRFVFQRDLKVLKKSENFNYISVNSICFGKILALYVPCWMRQQVLFPIYIHQIEHLIIKNNVLAFTRGFVKSIQKYLMIDCVLMAGIDYFHDYSFHLVCKELSIPFIVMFYEHYTIPYVQVCNTYLYKDFNYKFTGDAIITFGEKTAKVFIDSGVCDAEKIHITGAPRLDVWREVVKPSISENAIVLFSYPGVEYGAPINFIHVLHEFAKLSMRWGNKREFIIKCKDLNHKKQVLYFLQDINYKINIVIDVELCELLSKARAVISFNSLTCLEALLSRANIYIPYYADSHLSDQQLQISPCVLKKDISGMTFINSPEELIFILNKECAEDVVNVFDLEKRLSFFKEYFYFSENNTNSKEFENVLHCALYKNKPIESLI